MSNEAGLSLPSTKLKFLSFSHPDTSSFRRDILFSKHYLDSSEASDANLVVSFEA